MRTNRDLVKEVIRRAGRGLTAQAVLDATVCFADRLDAEFLLGQMCAARELAVFRNMDTGLPEYSLAEMVLGPVLTRARNRAIAERSLRMATLPEARKRRGDWRQSQADVYLALTDAKRPLAASVIAAKVGLSSATVKVHLRTLRREGLAERVGSGPAVQYQLARATGPVFIYKPEGNIEGTDTKPSVSHRLLIGCGFSVAAVAL